MSKTQFSCFYSYKGGVGRSLLLANLAFIYANQGKKVLILDLDLEAPGQQQTELFADEFAAQSSTQYNDLFNLFEDYTDVQKDKEKIRLFDPDLSRYMVRSGIFERTHTKHTKSQYGSIHLLPATVKCDNHYQSKVAEWTWDTFYNDYNGAAFWHILKEKAIAAGFDKVLIDSRTGFNEVFYISSLILADTFVCVSALNRQNVEGIQRAVETLEQRQVIENFGRKKIIKVLSLVPRDQDELISERKKAIQTHFPSLHHWHGELPYTARLAIKEDVLVIRPAHNNEYATAVQQVLEAIETDDTNHETDKATPFDNLLKEIRVEYCSEEQVAKFYVDPGGKVKEAMLQFMPTVIYGARGTGKTTLARWHAYETQAYRLRMQGITPLPKNIQQIGLWFRIDVDVLDAFNIADPKLQATYNGLFGQFIDLLILRKALNALDTFGGVGAWGKEQQIYRHLTREMDIRQEPPTTFEEMEEVIADQLANIRAYINNPTEMPTPYTVQGNIFFKLLVEKMKLFTQSTKKHYFMVCIDEYENFHTYQQKILNTRLKQTKVSDRLTYKLFVRNDGIKTYATLATEQNIEEIHDYRSYSLDEGLSFGEFKQHIDSVIQSRLKTSPYFGSRAISKPNELLATISLEDEASQICAKNNNKLDKQLLKLVHQDAAFEHSEHYQWYKKEPSVLRRAVIIVLLQQGKTVDEVFNAFFDDSQKSRDWYHNYKTGALFWLCRLYRKDKTYAGFDQIVGIAGNNIRTALDLLYVVLEAWSRDTNKHLPIDIATQTKAVKARAEVYFKQMKVQTMNRREIPQMLERLGKLFEVLHHSPKQSEPEINHFFLRGHLSDKANKLLRRCRREAYLRLLPGNKRKVDTDSYREAYQLTPNFAPFFQFSWRRKKALYLDASELETCMFGDKKEWNKIHNKYKNKKVQPTEEQHQDALF